MLSPMLVLGRLVCAGLFVWCAMPISAGIFIKTKSPRAKAIFEVYM